MKPRRTISIDGAMKDRNLLGAALGESASWSTWTAILKAAFALPLDAAELEVFSALAGGRAPPKARVRELWVLAGRRGGKSRMAALIAVFIAVFQTHRLAAGELGSVLILAASLDQARVVFGYAKAFLTASPILAQEIEGETQSEIRLRNGISIISRANSFRTTRGRTLVAAIFDEAAFWKDETSAMPDVETYTAILPSLSTVNGMLISISSAYRRSGMMYVKHRDFFGVDSDDTLVIAGSTQQFNPKLDVAVIEAAAKADPAAAKSEWFSEFRSDLSAFLDDELVERATDHGRPLELAPQRGIFYRAYVDPAGASGHDSYAIAIGHKVGERYVVDLVRGTKLGMPYDPAAVTLAYGKLCQEYKIGSVVGDAYAAEWVSQAWSKTGVSYVRSDLPKSQIYLEILPLFSREVINLPNHARLLRELRLLERRVHRSGRDSVDHGKTGHDDHANSACGVLRVLSAYGGNIDLDIWRRAIGDIPDTLPELDPRYADFASRPTSGPDQPGAYRLGSNGYHAPNFSEVLRLAAEAAATAPPVQEPSKQAVNVFPRSIR